MPRTIETISQSPLTAQSSSGNSQEKSPQEATANKIAQAAPPMIQQPGHSHKRHTPPSSQPVSTLVPPPLWIPDSPLPSPQASPRSLALSQSELALQQLAHFVLNSPQNQVPQSSPTKKSKVDPTRKPLETLFQKGREESKEPLLRPLFAPQKNPQVLDLTSCSATPTPNFAIPPFIQLLRLCDKKDGPEVLLSQWMFDPARSETEKKMMHDTIQAYFESKPQFQVLMKQFKGMARKQFKDQLDELLEKNQFLSRRILYSFLAWRDPKKARQIERKDRVSHEKVEYPKIPHLVFSDRDCVERILEKMIESSNIGELNAVLGTLLPNAKRQQAISGAEFQRMIQKVKERILYPGSGFLCLQQNEPPLKQAIEMLKLLNEPELLKDFQTLFVVDMDHMTQLNYSGGQIKGLHIYPDEGKGVYETPDTRITARCLYPQYLTESTMTGPVLAEVSSSSGCGGSLSKISTFPRRKPTEKEMMEAIENTLCHPLNHPDASKEMQYFLGRDRDGTVRIVWVDIACKRVTSSYPIPFYEVRDLDPTKQELPFHGVLIQHEASQAPIPIKPAISPQQKLSEYIATQVDVNKNRAKPLSNQTLQPFIQNIKKALQRPESPFEIIPTREEGPIILRTSLEKCGHSLQTFLLSGYRPSKNQSGSAKKRISPEKLGEVFPDPELYLQFRDWTALAGAILK